MKKKRVLMLARGVGEYTEVLTNAAFLRKRYHISIVRDFILKTKGQKAFEIKAKKAKISCYTTNPYEKVNYHLNHKPSLWKKILKKIRKLQLKRKFGIYQLEKKIVSPDSKGLYKFLGILSKPYYDFKKGFLNPLKSMRKRARRFGYVLDKAKPDIFILNNANGGTLSEIYIKECHKRNIPTIIIPFTYVFPVAPAKTYSHVPEYRVKGIKKAIMKRYFPNWLYQYKKKTMTRLPFGQVLCHRILKVEPPLPWVQDSSTCKYILAESELLKQHYINLGIDKASIKLTGKPNMDYLHSLIKKKKSLTKKIIKELALPKTKPIITLAIPSPTDVYTRKQFKVEFKSHDEIFKYLVKQVSKIKSHSIILSLHPSLRNNPEDLAKYQTYQTENIKICNRPTAEMIAVSDMYIASGSGTILWALAAGCAVMDYDVLGLDFNFYSNNPDLITPKNKKQFEKEINKICAKPELIKEIKTRMKDRKSYYGKLDGKAVKRIQEVISELVN